MFPKYREIPYFESELIWQHNIATSTIYDQIHGQEEDIVALEKREWLAEEFQTQFLRESARKYEISFELNLLQEHQAAFRTQAEIYLKAALKSRVPSEQGFFTFDIYNDELEEGHFTLNRVTRLACTQYSHLQKHLHHESNMFQFFTMIYELAPLQVADQLLYIALFTWDNYLTFKHPFLNLTEIKKNARKLAIAQSSHLYAGNRIKYLNLRQADSEQLKCSSVVKTAFTKFIEFWCTTIMLILEEYFENSYNENSAEIKSEATFAKTCQY